MFCPGVGTCLVFLDNWLVAFGNPGQLKTILQARGGQIVSLSLNRFVVDLMSSARSDAPVCGVATGSQLDSVITSELRDKTGSQIDWSQFSSVISVFGYSVSFDTGAHVNANLQCKSELSAVFLKQALTVVANVQSLAVQAGKDPQTLPFQNLQVTSSGNTVTLKMDTAIPGS
jgi:hypothetical protein